MVKIKEVCEKTGLSEKAVRLYMKEGLVHPKTEEGIYRNAYYFSEKDIELLKDIAVLRNAGFSISDIRQMQKHPESIPAMIEEKQNLLAAEIYEKRVLQSALERLAETERGTTKGLAGGIRPAVQHEKEEKIKSVKSKCLQYVATISSLFALLILMIYLKFGVYMIIVVFGSLAVILGAVSLFMSYRYMTVISRGKNMSRHGEGYVAGIVRNGGINISYARAGGGTAGAKEPGAGSSWLLLMMLWNEI